MAQVDQLIQPITTLNIEEEKGKDIKEEELKDKKLEGIKRLLSILGAEGSLMVENINKVLSSTTGNFSVDEQGNIKII